MHGFDEAFIVQGCQKAIKLFSLQSRKFLRQTFFLGWAKIQEFPFLKLEKLDIYFGCRLMQSLESFFGCISLAVCHAISPLDSHPLFSSTLLNKNVNKYI